MESEPKKSITFRVTAKLADIYHRCAESEGYCNLTAWIVTALNERAQMNAWKDSEQPESEAP